MSCCHFHGEDVDHYNFVGDFKQTTIGELKEKLVESKILDEELVIFSQGCACGSGEHFVLMVIADVVEEVIVDGSGASVPTTYARLTCGAGVDLSLANQWFVMDYGLPADGVAAPQLEPVEI